MAPRHQLTLPAWAHDALLAHATAGHPLEVGGLLAGRDGLILKHFPLPNALASPTAFRSDPASTMAAAKAMRFEELDVIAVYHSHPTSAPVPSARDLLERYGDVPTLIVGENTIRAWRLFDDRFEEIEILIDPREGLPADPRQVPSPPLRGRGLG